MCLLAILSSLKISPFRSSVQFLIGFFVWGGEFILNCRSSWYILYISPLSYVLFANFFSHSIGRLFVLLIVSFAVQELFSLM